MIRIRGIPVTSEDARALARLLREDADGVRVAVALDRALAADGGLVAADPDEARAVLAALRVYGRESERLLELRAGLLAMVGDEHD